MLGFGKKILDLDAPLNDGAALRERLHAALRKVPCAPIADDIVEAGIVAGLRTDKEGLTIELLLPTPALKGRRALEQSVLDTARRIVDVNVRLEVTSKVRMSASSPDGKQDLPGIANVILVASGKGGVGKSTVTVNLAIALAETGARVGLMDADVYGPCIPLMMGAQDERPYTKGNKIIPIQRFGVQLMSLGFLLEEGQAVLWRGPMVAGTVKQLLADVDWGTLDYLLVDLPPGTGDAPMSLAQLVPLTGVLIVSTPHNVAANIAGKAVQLFQRLNSPILGVVENMGPYIDEDTGKEVRMFHGTDGDELAKVLKVPFLGRIPFDSRISKAGDAGVPSMITHPHTEQAEGFRHIAGQVAQQSSIIAMTRRDLTRLSEAPAKA